MTPETKQSSGRRAVLAGLGLALFAVAVLGGYWATRGETRQFALGLDSFQAGLDAGLAADPEVGLLPRVQFEGLRIGWQDGLVLTGVGRWFNPNAGGYTKPDVTLRAVLSGDAAAWALDGEVLSPARVEVVSAYREPHGLVEGWPEVDGGASWERYLVRFLGRQPMFRRADLAGQDWRLVRVEASAAGLVFTVER